MSVLPTRNRVNMTSKPGNQASSKGSRLRPLWLLLPCFLGLVGCNAFKTTVTGPATAQEKPPPQTLPGKYHFRVSQFVLYSDFQLQRDLPIFKELEVLRDRVHKELRLPSNNTIVHVYLFEDKDRYEKFMQASYPDLPKRRAFFVAQPWKKNGPDDLLVYTYWGDRIQQDLRHELTHALLHGVLKDVPLWLDEGLAEYYEVPATWKGTNYQHLDLLLHAPAAPDLARLEDLDKVQQMKQSEYREAWAWVHLMLNGKPEGRQVLLDYLQVLRSNSSAGSLRERLQKVYADPSAALTTHLKQISKPEDSAVQK